MFRVSNLPSYDNKLHILCDGIEYYDNRTKVKLNNYVYIYFCTPYDIAKDIYKYVFKNNNLCTGSNNDSLIIEEIEET